MIGGPLRVFKTIKSSGENLKKYISCFGRRATLNLEGKKISNIMFFTILVMTCMYLCDSNCFFLFSMKIFSNNIYGDNTDTRYPYIATFGGLGKSFSFGFGRR
uniref:Uncharacterized protein n=1 Tax=Cacopsylla melanoneura TaxID=428564 RepID=A0A8D8QLY7_9HEMI